MRKLRNEELDRLSINQYKNSEAAAGLTPDQIQSNGLAIVNRMVQEAYQPTSPDFLPADIRRGGSFAKSFFQFATEPKSKLGIYFKDIRLIRAEYQKGNKEKAIKDAIRVVVGQNLIVPGAYWLAGEMMRGLTDQDEWDAEEAIRRLGTGILLGPAAGLLVWGAGFEIIAQTLTGDKIFFGGSSVPSDRIMNEVGFLMRTIKDDEELIKKIDDIAQRYNPAYKYTKKIIKNN